MTRHDPPPRRFEGIDHYNSAARWASTKPMFLGTDAYTPEYRYDGIMEFVRAYKSLGICPKGELPKSPSTPNDRDWVLRQVSETWAKNTRDLRKWRLDDEHCHYHWSDDGYTWYCPRSTE